MTLIKRIYTDKKSVTICNIRVICVLPLPSSHLHIFTSSPFPVTIRNICVICVPPRD